jgi:hypothetical protein
MKDSTQPSALSIQPVNILVNGEQHRCNQTDQRQERAMKSIG